MLLGNQSIQPKGSQMVHKAPVKRRTARPRKAKFRLGYASSRALKHIPPTELKAYDQTYTNAGFNHATLAGGFLNIPVLGTEFYNRVGRKIYMKSIQIQGILQNASTGSTDLGRILIVYDTQTNGNAIAFSDVLQDASAAAASSGTSMINLNNRQRFRIIKDQFFYFPAVTNTGGVLTNTQPNMDAVEKPFYIDWYIPLNMLETVYNAANAGAGTDIISGALFIMLVTKNFDNQWAFTFNTRLRFYD